MTDGAAILTAIIFVLICWIVAVMIWRGANKRLAAWREIIKKDDHAYFINRLGEKAFVKVLAVDRSRVNTIQVELMIGGTVTTPWVEAAELYPVPTPTEDK